MPATARSMRTRQTIRAATKRRPSGPSSTTISAIVDRGPPYAQPRVTAGSLAAELGLSFGQKGRDAFDEIRRSCASAETRRLRLKLLRQRASHRLAQEPLGIA